MTVRIVTDSSCDLTAEQAAELGVEVVPLSIRFGDEEFTDRVELTVDEFYRRLETSATLPETAAPAPGAFEQAFKRAAGEGADSVVCITISSDLSATIQSAQNAARAMEGQLDVRVIDSHSITLGLGSQVLVAAQAANGGRSADEVVALVESMARRTHVLGALDTLENLKKGGRIGGAQAFLGSMLSIKPIIEVRDGKVEPEGRQRTRSKALAYLAEKVRDAGKIDQLAVLHGDAPDIDEFVDMIATIYPRDELIVGDIGSEIGAHSGPRINCVAYTLAR
jgi:DegV family protein with EDD domain